MSVGSSVASAVDSETYTVTEEDKTLGIIALKLYGNADLWPEIAEWNSMSAPYKVVIGQKLTLKRKPTISSSEGAKLLLEMYRRRFGIDAEPVDRPDAPKKAPAKLNEAEEYRRALVILLDESAQSTPTAEDFFDQGRAFFAQKNFEKALESFQRSRKEDDEYLASWFYEFLVLRTMNRLDDERKTKILFVGKHPQFKVLPLFQNLEEGKRP